MFGHFFAPEISPPTAYGATEPVIGTKTSELAAFYEVVSLILPPAIICLTPRAEESIVVSSQINVFQSTPVRHRFSPIITPTATTIA